MAEQLRRYFDNSATSHPKPPGVRQAVLDYFDRVHASAGRGAYREAIESGRIIDRCRQALRTLFGAADEDLVIFTLNGTDALNLAIKGLVGPGDHVVTTAMDHNSVLRPLSALAEQQGVQWTAVAADPQTTRVTADAVRAALRPNTKLVAFNHASNVTGVLQPLDDVAALCHERGILLLVDAAQSAGHVPIQFRKLGLDLLACPGHKGLLGPLGTGVLLIRGDVAGGLRTVREGGTGSQSEQARQPDEGPDRFEAGSHNAHGLAGLLAGVDWVLAQGVDTLRQHEVELCHRFMTHLAKLPNVQWFGPRDTDFRVAVFSIRVPNLEPAELSALLESRYGVLSRSGLHCAPLAHETIGTLRIGGTTRLSCGPFLTPDDVDAAAAALAEIAAGGSALTPAHAATPQRA